MDYPAIGEIKAMKEKINLSIVLDPRVERDVKLGPGAIREIEFIVQAFQLVHGGQNPSIREPTPCGPSIAWRRGRFLPLEDNLH